MSSVELFRAEEGNVTPVRLLEEHDLLLLKQHSYVLMEFQRHHALIEYVIHNFNALLSLFVDKTQEVATSADNLIHYPFENFYFEVNTVILNFLASAKTFLDHMDTLTSHIGDSSPEKMKYDALTSNEYDTNFSYRLLGKLRNYVMHYGMPPISYNLNKKYDDTTCIVETSLEILIDREQLLKSKKSWNKKVREDIEAQEPKFAILMLFCEYMYSLSKIHTEYTKLFLLPSALDAKRFILDIIGHGEGFYSNIYHAGTVTPCEDNNDSVNISLSCIPASLIKKVDHFISLENSIMEEKTFFQYGELDCL